jgi:thiamine kinase-like enzyme
MHEQRDRLMITASAEINNRDCLQSFVGVESSPEEDLSDVKVGNNLQTVDVFMIKRAEREHFLPLLRNIYGINFTNYVRSTPYQSFTSRKCLVEDDKGRIYFLKEKPEYSVSQERLKASSMLQYKLSEKLSFIPPIIPTIDNSPYAHIHGKIILLTPYVEGDIFMGRMEQSLSSAETLAKMHVAVSDLPLGNEIETTTEALITMVEWTDNLAFPDIALKKSIISKLSKLGLQFSVSQDGPYGWIHTDVAPYNTLYKDNKVLAINDFDNVIYGPLAKDLAILLLDHCGLNYAGASSSFGTPIRTVLDIHRMDQMLGVYLKTSGNNINEFKDIPNQITSMWLEYMALGLLRGDYSLKDVDKALHFSENLYRQTAELVKKYEIN